MFISTIYLFLIGTLRYVLASGVERGVPCHSETFLPVYSTGTLESLCQVQEKAGEVSVSIGIALSS